MEFTFTETIWSLLPAVVMIILVIRTKKVILSLWTGIILGALMLANFQPFDAEGIIATSIAGTLGDTWYRYILYFLFLIGITNAFISLNGGARAFVEVMIKRVKTEKSAQLLTWILGIIIFFDDYFNALVIGELTKPLTDRYSVSRAKLAYIIDSTSAPVVILAPISSWGAYIITTLGGIFAEKGFTTYTGLQAFVGFIPYQYYALTSVVMVAVMIIFKINVGDMKKFEDSADEGHDLSLSPTAVDLTKELGIETKNNGSMWDLLLPIITLVGVTLWGMKITAGDVGSLQEVLENTDVTASLFYGGLAAVGVSFLQVLFNLNKGAFKLEHVGKALVAGIKSMLPANAILISAWAIGDMIGQLGTGDFLATAINSANIPAMLLPAIVFLIAAFMAFSTGTSWGTFGILLPISATVALAVDPDVILVLMAATLSGSIFGDHCSPISDTTIMSSTGAQCNHVDHFSSQIPYALICGGFTFIAYLIYGLTGSMIVPLVSLVILMVGFVLLFKGKNA